MGFFSLPAAENVRSVVRNTDSTREKKTSSENLKGAKGKILGKSKQTERFRVGFCEVLSDT